MQRKPQKKIQVYHIITSASGYYELKKKKKTATSSYKNFIQLRDTYFMNTCKKKKKKKRG